MENSTKSIEEFISSDEECNENCEQHIQQNDMLGCIDHDGSNALLESYNTDRFDRNFESQASQNDRGESKLLEKEIYKYKWTNPQNKPSDKNSIHDKCLKKVKQSYNIDKSKSFFKKSNIEESSITSKKDAKKISQNFTNKSYISLSKINHSLSNKYKCSLKKTNAKQVSFIKKSTHPKYKLFAKKSSRKSKALLCQNQFNKTHETEKVSSNTLRIKKTYQKKLNRISHVDDNLQKQSKRNVLRKIQQGSMHKIVPQTMKLCLSNLTDKKNVYQHQKRTNMNATSVIIPPVSKGNMTEPKTTVQRSNFKMDLLEQKNQEIKDLQVKLIKTEKVHKNCIKKLTHEKDQQITTLYDKVTKYKNKYRTIKNEIKELREYRAKKEPEILTFKAQLKCSNQQIQNLENQIKEYRVKQQDEILNLKDQLKCSGQHIQNLQNQIKELRQENEKYKTKFAEFEMNDSQKSSRNEHLYSLDFNTSTVKINKTTLFEMISKTKTSGLTNSTDYTSKKTDSTIQNQLTVANAKLKRENIKLNKKNKELQRTLAKTDNNISTLYSENVRLTECQNRYQQSLKQKFILYYHFRKNMQNNKKLESTNKSDSFVSNSNDDF